MIVDMENSLNLLWNNLPIDSVIASILDPRVKEFQKIPQNEIDEAKAILKDVQQ